MTHPPSHLSRRRFIHHTTLAGGALILATTIPSRAQPTGQPRIRKDIRKYSTAELNSLRKALLAMFNDNGDHGFQKIAGLHGEPDRFCHKDPDIFLPWHRSYILRFEEALRKKDSTVTLPFWEWTDDDSIANGIPAAYANSMAMIDGQQQANPLFAARISVLNNEQTSRNPRDPLILGSLAQALANCFNATAYEAFNSNLDSGPHGSLHTWVRGHMGSISHAAYDPVFWAHHCNVDRQWAQWQLGPNNASPTGDILERNLQPFGKKVKDVLRIREDLGYDYDDLHPMPQSPLHNLANGNLMRVENFDFNPVNDGVFLQLNELVNASESLNVDVFINQPGANEKTPLKDNPNYAGSFGIFGGAGHAHETQKQVARSLRAINLTSTLTRLKEKGLGKEVEIKLVITNMDGKPVEAKAIPAKSISLMTE